MPRVELAVGARLPGYPLRPAGYVMDVDDAVFEEFSPRGFFVDPSAPAEVKPAEPKKAKPEPKPTAKSEPKAEVNRPKNTASLKVWQDYAKSHGIDTKGLAKREIIAATR